MRNRAIVALSGILLAMLASGPALAHHAMGGALPNTATQALLSGLAHPVIGLDHLAFIVAAGLLAGLTGKPLLAPLAFIGGTLAGAGLHIAGLDIPLVEIAIAFSVVAAGAAVSFRRTGPFAVLAALLALAGVMHGYAYAESIVGAEPGPLYAYLAGFALVQFAIAAGVALAARQLARGGHAARLRFAGVAIIVVGLLPLSGLI